MHDLDDVAARTDRGEENIFEERGSVWGVEEAAERIGEGAVEGGCGCGWVSRAVVGSIV